MYKGQGFHTGDAEGFPFAPSIIHHKTRSFLSISFSVEIIKGVLVFPLGPVWSWQILTSLYEFCLCEPRVALTQGFKSFEEAEVNPAIGRRPAIVLIFALLKKIH